MRKRILIPLLTLTLLLAYALSTQLQPGLLLSLGAVDGSFGVRPMSHQCLGVRLGSSFISWLPAADFRFSVGNFSVRYWVDEEVWPKHTYCIGQDVWFGE